MIRLLYQAAIFLSLPVASMRAHDTDYFFESIQTIPDTVHYEAYNNEPYFMKKRDKARQDLVSQLIKLGADKKPIKRTDFAIYLMPSWHLDFGNRDPNDVVSLADGKFQITVGELQKLNSTSYVSYTKSELFIDSRFEQLTHDRMQNMLQNGATTKVEYCLAMFRLLVSEVAAFRSSLGKPNHRKLEEPLVTYRLYSTNAPNVAYDTTLTSLFCDEEGLTPLYKATLKKIFCHVLDNMQQDEIEVVVLPGFGLGSFMPDSLKIEGTKIWAEALRETLSENPYTFKGYIVADPSKSLTKVVKDAYNKELLDHPFHFTNKSCLDIVHHGATLGLKIGLLNAADPACITGQYWQEGHIALEEMCALFTTVLFSQSAGINPYLLKRMKAAS